MATAVRGLRRGPRSRKFGPRRRQMGEVGDLWLLGRTPAALRRCAAAAELRASCCGRAGADGVHRSALQCADRRPCLRPGLDQAPRVRHGLGRDVRGRVHRLPHHRAVANRGRRSADGAIHFVCMDWRHMAELLDAGRKAVYSSSRTSASGTRTTAAWAAFYRSKHELVFVFKAGTAPHINNFELGEHGRYRTNVWDYAGRQHASARPAGRACACTRRSSRWRWWRTPSRTARSAGRHRARRFRRQRHDAHGGPEDRPRGALRSSSTRSTSTSRSGAGIGSALKKAVHAETGLSFDELAATRRAAIEARCKTRVRARAAHGGSDRGR